MKTLLLAFVVLLYTAQAANLTPKVPTQKVLAQINNLCVNAIRLYQGCDFTAINLVLFLIALVGILHQ